MSYFKKEEYELIKSALVTRAEFHAEDNTECQELFVKVSKMAEEDDKFIDDLLEKISQ